MTPAGRPPARCHEQTEQLEPGFLGKRPERGNRMLLIHGDAMDLQQFSYHRN